MADLKRAVTWADTSETNASLIQVYKAASELVAANEVSEGARVGTIARRPDGEWLAVRKSYCAAGDTRWFLYALSNQAALTPYPTDADSWPVIFAPNEVGSSEHSVSDGDAYDPTKPIGPEIWRLAEWLEEHDDGEPYEIYTPDGSYGYRLSAAKVGHHPTAQQEPCCGVSEVYDCDCPPAIRVSPKPRSPRVVDRLGVDEQGSRWRGRRGSVYQQDTGGWRTDDGRLWRSPYKPWTDAPYTEILEPRVLLTLDCEEARDGTVWGEAYPGVWTFWHNGVWMTNQGEDGGQYPVQESVLLVRFGPYTEVLDVG
ncbi:hypothetical protein BKG71_19380 [Mycobacteroides chelonae]|nr:hypothetical protein BKG71_19380 [Mycobacteroides chelonae]